MKKHLVSIFVIALAAGLVGAMAAQTAKTPLKDGDYTQPEPYTAKFFGPWNEGVAKTHVPEVTVEKQGMGLKVSVQIDNHPMDPQKPHWIMWIKVEDVKGNKLGEKTFQATDPGPAKAVFELPKMYGRLRVFQRCNIHGIWLNETTVAAK